MLRELKNEASTTRTGPDHRLYKNRTRPDHPVTDHTSTAESRTVILSDGPLLNTDAAGVQSCLVEQNGHERRLRTEGLSRRDCPHLLRLIRLSLSACAGKGTRVPRRLRRVSQQTERM
ncbi:hypothetical protein SKAU_G00240610 [Synaphobranchus kaupii]|uniref:Uncharacterized protein n=1 Tax=Synaphobranchus kaupii TaxID=118154 RepID=A0A9Q1ITB4_SYNKA|nr:hypothetical protein SKAU_G00240610 [Synaphobranchus kaupii]